MLRKIKCVCGVEKTLEVNNMTVMDYEKNDFDFIWDITDGLTDIPLCKSCSNKVKEHVKAIEKIIKRDISDVHFR